MSNNAATSRVEKQTRVLSFQPEFAEEFIKRGKELEAGLLNKRLIMLSLSFRCDQIYMYEICDFGHTLLCYLSQTQMFDKFSPQANLLNESSCLAPPLGVTKNIIIRHVILVILCCAAQVRLSLFFYFGHTILCFLGQT